MNPGVVTVLYTVGSTHPQLQHCSPRPGICMTLLSSDTLHASWQLHHPPLVDRLSLSANPAGQH